MLILKVENTEKAGHNVKPRPWKMCTLTSVVRSQHAIGQTRLQKDLYTTYPEEGNIRLNRHQHSKAPHDQVIQQDCTKLFPYLGKSFITPACSNTTKDFSSKLMGWMDLLKAIKYKKNLTIGKCSRGIDGDRRVLWKLDK